MNQIKFSIITVCYNASNCIAETIDSLLSQKFTDYEYLIQDGKSTDDTMNQIEKITSGKQRVYVCSETDEGIYDAMNKALKKAKGEYIFFLNAGDCFADDAVLERVSEFIEKNNVDIAYGNIVQIQNGSQEIRKFGKFCQSDLYFLIGSCICHQAMFAKRALFEKKRFNIQYQVCADREWLMFQKKNGAVIKAMNFLVATILVEGFSSSHVRELEQETEECLKAYYCKKEWIYKVILGCKRNKIIERMLSSLEKALFVRRKG